MAKCQICNLNNQQLLILQNNLTSWIILKTSLIARGMIPGEFWSPCTLLLKTKLDFRDITGKIMSIQKV